MNFALITGDKKEIKREIVFGFLVQTFGVYSQTPAEENCKNSNLIKLNLVIKRGQHKS